MSVIRRYKRPANFDELLLMLRLFMADNGVVVETERIHGGGYRLNLELHTGHSAFLDVHSGPPKAG